MPAPNDTDAAAVDATATAPASEVPAAASAADSAQQLQARMMRHSLQVLLDRVRGSREALPHLAALEAALGNQGTAALDSASQKVLAKIHTQLRVLPLDPADGPIQDLVALVRRTLRRHSSQQTHQLSPFDPEATVVITEASHSDFINALGDAHRARH